jgi:hypothetical protein
MVIVSSRQNCVEDEYIGVESIIHSNQRGGYNINREENVLIFKKNSGFSKK